MKKIKSIHIIIALVAILVIGVPARYAIGNLSDSTVSADELRISTEELRDRVDAAQAVRDDQDAYETRLQNAQTAVPEGQDLTDLIEQLDALAADTNVQVTSGSPSLAGGDEPVFTNSYMLTLSLSASPADTVKFIQGLRTLPRLVVTDNVSVNDDTTTLNARFFSEDS